MTTIITPQSDTITQHLNPVEILRHLWHHRDLIRQFTKREVEGRYKGSFLGIFWSFINPLLLLFIYTFVFGVVLKARWPEARTNNLGEFAVVLFCGLTAFNIFSECVSRAPGLIVGVPNYVKKVVFPLEIIPVSILGSALFHSLINLGILVVANILVGGAIYWSVLLLPIVVLPLIFLSLGLTWFLASLGVFVRDISYTTSLVVQMLFFLTPIFYPIESIPKSFQAFVKINPLASITDNFRRVVLWGLAPDWASFGIWFIISAAALVLGYGWFVKTKKAFADVL